MRRRPQICRWNLLPLLVSHLFTQQPRRAARPTITSSSARRGRLQPLSRGLRPTVARCLLLARHRPTTPGLREWRWSPSSRRAHSYRCRTTAAARLAPDRSPPLFVPGIFFFVNSAGSGHDPNRTTKQKKAKGGTVIKKR